MSPCPRCIVAVGLKLASQDFSVSLLVSGSTYLTLRLPYICFSYALLQRFTDVAGGPANIACIYATL